VSESIPPVPGDWQQPPRQVPEAEFVRRARRAKREASERRRGIQPGKPDPLAGQRKGLADGTASRLIYPGGSPCPVTPGEMFTLRGGVEITITSCVRRLKSGKHRWECAFERRVPEKTLFLRRVPPIRELEADDDGKVAPPTLSDIERARLESSYTTTARGAVPDTGGVVDPDWHDQGKEKREEMRLQAVKDIKHDELRDRKVRQVRAKLAMVGVWETQHGVDSLPTLDRLLSELEALDPTKKSALEGAA